MSGVLSADSPFPGRVSEGPPTSLSQMSIFLAPSLIFFDGKDEIRFRFRSATDLQSE